MAFKSHKQDMFWHATDRTCSRQALKEAQRAMIQYRGFPVTIVGTGIHWKLRNPAALHFPCVWLQHTCVPVSPIKESRGHAFLWDPVSPEEMRSGGVAPLREVLHGLMLRNELQYPDYRTPDHLLVILSAAE